MRKATITITFDEDKISALVMYLEKKNMRVEDELMNALENLYVKNVPAGVRNFIDMKAGLEPAAPPRIRKPKLSSSSAVGAPAPEVQSTEPSSE